MEKMMTIEETFLLKCICKNTCKNKDNPEFIHKCGGQLPNNTVFDRKKKTIFTINGYLSTICTQAWSREIKDQLLCRGDFNVFVVDYPDCNGPDYATAVKCTLYVGRDIACIILNIAMRYNLTTLDSFHLIGHSLGAHIAGIVGYCLKDKGLGLIGRITGLDPAGPAYMNASTDVRLDKSDAKYVDVIHTNGGECLPYFGYPYPSGHVDFYPNGGKLQNGCLQEFVLSFLTGDPIYAFGYLSPHLCSHLKSIEYFKATINPCKCNYTAVKCNNSTGEYKVQDYSCSVNGTNCGWMGFDAKNCTMSDGQYCLNTMTDCPYCSTIPKEKLNGYSCEYGRQHCFPEKCVVC